MSKTSRYQETEVATAILLLYNLDVFTEALALTTAVSTCIRSSESAFFSRDGEKDVTRHAHAPTLDPGACGARARVP